MSDIKQTAENILHRITSPWFFTFIPWWVVFNYDFLILVFGDIEILNNINLRYCGTKGLFYTVGGCFDVEWNWWMEPIIRKFAIPFTLTIVSLVMIQWFIVVIEECYYSIRKGNYLYKKQRKKYKAALDKCQIVLDNKDKQYNELQEQFSKLKNNIQETNRLLRERTFGTQWDYHPVMKPFELPTTDVHTEYKDVKFKVINKIKEKLRQLHQPDAEADSFLETILHENPRIKCGLSREMYHEVHNYCYNDEYILNDIHFMQYIIWLSKQDYSGIAKNTSTKKKNASKKINQ